ncbi:MAG: hypothetical protein KDK78_00155, partial [Chlamydiia bacterium]|nr:hypothetical protein [Chlamydiia bacterium]
MQSTEISREDAALIIQSAYRRHRVLNLLTQQKRTLCEKIESVTGKIFTLTNRYQISLMHALEQSRMMTFTYIQKIENLNAITQRVAALYSKYVASKTGALGQLELIASQFEIEHACLRKLALNGGAASLSELLEFECGPNWREVIPSRALETISFYDSLFFPRETTQAIYSPYEKGGGEVVLLPDGEKIDYDEAELNEGKCLFTEPRIFSAATPQDHVCGAELCIPYEAEGRQRLLIVRGHFADDPTGLSSQVGPLFEKRQQVIEQLSDKDVPEPFKAGWLAHYALQGWSMKSAETIVRETCEAYADAKTLQTYSSRRIISDIQKCAYQVRREIVLQLLLAQDPALGLQVMEQLKDKAPDAYYDLFLHMPIQAQLYFDEARCTLEHRWSALNKAVSGPVDLQKQIKHSSMPDSAKQQALEKQEMLKKSVSGEAKAEEYLKRLLRFPWGK